MPASVAAARASESRYREGEAMDGSKGGKAHKGKKKGCSGCTKDQPCQGCSQNDGKSCSSNKMDAFSPQEYLKAVQLGIQNHGKSYIRARLDTEDAIRNDAPVGGKGKKCGNSYIPANATCNAGAGANTSATTTTPKRRNSIGNNKPLRTPGIGGKILQAYSTGTAAVGAINAGYNLSQGNFATALGQAATAAGSIRSANLARQGRSGKALANQIGTEVLGGGATLLGASFDMRRRNNDAVWADGFQDMMNDGNELALDAVVKPAGRGKKCGNSYIPANAKCNVGPGGGDGPAPAVFGRGKENLFNANNSLKSSAGVGLKRGASIGAALGAAYTVTGLIGGNSLANAGRGAVLGALGGAALGAAATGGAKLVRASNRSRANVNAAMPGLLRVAKQEERAVAKLKAQGADRATIGAMREKYAAKYGNEYDKTATNTFSNANERRYKPGQTPYARSRKGA